MSETDSASALHDREGDVEDERTLTTDGTVGLDEFRSVLLAAAESWGVWLIGVAALAIGVYLLSLPPEAPMSALDEDFFLVLAAGAVVYGVGETYRALSRPSAAS